LKPATEFGVNLKRLFASIGRIGKSSNAPSMHLTGTEMTTKVLSKRPCAWKSDFEHLEGKKSLRERELHFWYFALKPTFKHVESFKTEAHILSSIKSQQQNLGKNLIVDKS